MELSHRHLLPECPAIYFVLDPENRVLYIGRATNLLSRWKGHHRCEQLQRIHKKTPVRLAWLDYSQTPHLLAQVEDEFIQHYQPLLNLTQVPAKQIVPAEVALQKLLGRIANELTVFGIVPAQKGQLPTVLIMYAYYGRVKEVKRLRQLFQTNNRRPTSLKWVEFIRRKYGACWRARCNGVILELHPYSNYHLPTSQRKLRKRKLAGIPIQALSVATLTEVLEQDPMLRQRYRRLIALETDPIPLIWANLQQGKKGR